MCPRLGAGRRLYACLDYAHACRQRLVSRSRNPFLLPLLLQHRQPRLSPQVPALVLSACCHMCPSSAHAGAAEPEASQSLSAGRSPHLHGHSWHMLHAAGWAHSQTISRSAHSHARQQLKLSAGWCTGDAPRPRTAGTTRPRSAAAVEASSPAAAPSDGSLLAVDTRKADRARKVGWFYFIFTCTFSSIVVGVSKTKLSLRYDYLF